MRTLGLATPARAPAKIQLVGELFGPVMVVWFGILGLIGVVEVAGHPGILRDLSPRYGREHLEVTRGTDAVLLDARDGVAGQAPDVSGSTHHAVHHDEQLVFVRGGEAGQRRPPPVD